MQNMSVIQKSLAIGIPIGLAVAGTGLGLMIWSKSVDPMKHLAPLFVLAS